MLHFYNKAATCVKAKGPNYVNVCSQERTFVRVFYQNITLEMESGVSQDIISLVHVVIIIVKGFNKQANHKLRFYQRYTYQTELWWKAE